MKYPKSDIVFGTLNILRIKIPLLYCIIVVLRSLVSYTEWLEISEILKSNRESQKGTRPDAIIQINHPPQQLFKTNCI